MAKKRSQKSSGSLFSVPNVGDSTNPTAIIAGVAAGVVAIALSRRLKKDDDK